MIIIIFIIIIFIITIIITIIIIITINNLLVVTVLQNTANSFRPKKLIKTNYRYSGMEFSKDTF